MTTPSKISGPLGRALLFSGPAAGALIGFVWGLLYILFELENLTLQLPAQWAFIVLVGALTGAVLGLPITLIIGLPIHTFLVWQRRSSPSAYILMGVAAGFLLSMIAVTLQADEIGFYRLISAILFGIGSPLAAFFFWLIRRPDRDEPPAHLPQPPAA